jgi:hypothetical protein
MERLSLSSHYPLITTMRLCESSMERRGVDASSRLCFALEVPRDAHAQLGGFSSRARLSMGCTIMPWCRRPTSLRGEALQDLRVARLGSHEEVGRADLTTNEMVGGIYRSRCGRPGILVDRHAFDPRTHPAPPPPTSPPCPPLPPLCAIVSHLYVLTVRFKQRAMPEVIS